MADVFVSYAREDTAKARTIARALEQASFGVWFDERIHSGSEFSHEIEAALNSADAIVVLWSSSSVNSSWVRDEAAEGRDSGRLVPVLLDGSRPPIGFRQFQAADLSRWSGRGRPKQLDNLLAAICAKTGAPPRAVAETVTRPTAGARKSLYFLAATFAIAVIVAAFFFINRDRPEPQSAPSIALLPFTADSSDPEARKLASAMRDSVVHTLSHGAFAVSTIDAIPLGRPAADFLISGQATGTPEKFTATVRMEETAHHFVVFSRQFEASRDKVGDFAELIGAQVAAVLSWTAPIIAMERRHPSDPAITATLLQSTAERLDTISTLRDFETSRRLAEKAPNSPLAQNTVAFNTAFALEDLPRSERPDAVAAARRAADRTIELAPEFGGAYIPWCLLHSEQRWIQCEDHLRTGTRVDPDGPFNNWFLANLLNNVGRNREATELATLSLAHDQYMPFKIALTLRMLEIARDWDEEAALYRQANAWWPNNEAIAWYRLSGTAESGDFERLQRLRQEMDSSGRAASDPLLPLFAALKANSASAGKAACSRVAPEGFDATICMLALARLGDMDEAYRFADSLYPSRRGRTPADEERIWLDNPFPNLTAFLTAPAAAPLRRDDRYLALAGRLGLLEYWRTGRPPDFCREPPEPICAKLLGRV
jgi:TolB-like protein